MRSCGQADQVLPADRQRVLVIDHFARDADAVADVARDLGHPTVVLNHARAFEVAYRSFDPTLIVLNLYLPQFDGIDAARWLAEHGTRTHLALVSHHGSLFARAAKAIAEMAGFPVGFFSKPLTEGLVLDMLEWTDPAAISSVAGPLPALAAAPGHQRMQGGSRSG